MKQKLFTILTVLTFFSLAVEGKVVHLRPGVELPVMISMPMQNVLDNKSVSVTGYSWTTSNSNISIRSKSRDACVLYTSSMLNGGEATLKYWVTYLSGYRSETYTYTWTIRISPMGDKRIWGDIQNGDYFQDYTEEDHLMLFQLNTRWNELCADVTSYRNGNACISTSVKGKITIPEYPQGYPVVYINENSFRNLPEITDIVLPSTLKSIDNYFLLGCRNLQTLTCLAKNPPSMAWSNFFNDNYMLQNTVLIVPKGCKSQYKEAKGWKEFSIIKEIGETIENIQIDDSHFPDDNFRSYLLSLPSGTDGIITEAEKGKIKKIDVSDKNISSLKGMELFTDLESLDCNVNQLTSLDVSKNTYLKYLYCQGNNLTSLIIGDNDKLETVWCFNNELTSLDLSKIGRAHV